MLNMTAFDAPYFEKGPPEGLYNVDIGMANMTDFGHLHTFADLNADKYTDMVAVSGGNTLEVHAYDSYTKMFALWKSFAVKGCVEIHSVSVGRSSQNLRLFVTC